MRIRAVPIAAIAIAIAGLAWAAPGHGRSGGQDDSRFTLSGSLEPKAQVIGTGRFSLSGHFIRQVAAPVLEDSSFWLTASFAPAGAGLCTPDLIFANGFE